MGVLTTDCNKNFPEWTCYLGNVAGLCSTVIWFTVLVPQVLKNIRRRSIEGLSFLWALANFTASLTNFFFVFSHTMPLYTRISAVYMPCLEITILFQFLLWARVPFSRKMLVLAGCLCLWGAVIELNLTLCPSKAENIYWLAIALWSVETYPQVVLNMQRRSVSGLSLASVLITLLGKITDFVATYTLALPVEFVVMAYFSSSSAYINGFQMFWYGWDRVLSLKEYFKAVIGSLRGVCSKFQRQPFSQLHSNPDQGDTPQAQPDENGDGNISQVAASVSDDETERGEEGELLGQSGKIQSWKHGVKTSVVTRFRRMPANRRAGCFFTLALLAVFTFCFFWKLRFYAFVGPAFSISVLVLSYMYRYVKENEKLPTCYQRRFM